jgi:hypothetical protein
MDYNAIVLRTSREDIPVSRMHSKKVKLCQAQVSVQVYPTGTWGATVPILGHPDSTIIADVDYAVRGGAEG